jgi:hypothetical protein
MKTKFLICAILALLSLVIITGFMAIPPPGEEIAPGEAIALEIAPVPGASEAVVIDEIEIGTLSGTISSYMVVFGLILLTTISAFVALRNSIQHRINATIPGSIRSPGVWVNLKFPFPA